MYCKKISVKNFRNIEEESVSFDRGINVLVGENAQGKTNLLEAIFYGSVGKSFRVNHSSEMIRFGEDYAQILLEYHDSVRDQTLMMRLFRDKRRQVEKNHVKVDRLSDIVGGFRAVLFCPEHLSLIKDGPSERRVFLDIAISRMYPLYMKSLQRYCYILKQRNALIRECIKQKKTFDDTAEIWSLQLAKEAATLSRYRVEFLRRCEKYVKKCFSEMTGDGEEPSLGYVGTLRQDEESYLDEKKTEKEYIRVLTSSFEREVMAGSTLFGIHKDDIDIRLNGKSARLYASQGQQRSLALSLKLAEGDICFEEFGDYPVFLFDDVLSELDAKRREYLLGKIQEKQVIMTSCEKIPLTKAHLISVKNGSYR